jgi:hypothetical protein
MITLPNRISTLTAIVCVVACLSLARPVFAVDVLDDPMQIDERLEQLSTTTNSLCWEMHRYHQQQPEFTPTYRLAKQVWSRCGELRDALRDGPVETDALTGEVNQMNTTLKQIEATLAKWGSGDLSQVATTSGPSERQVVTSGTEVDLPLIGIRVGRPQVVVTDDGPPQLARRRLHPNSRGSKRSLEREVAAVRVAMDYLIEDAGLTAPPAPSPGSAAVPAAASAASTEPTPQPPPRARSHVRYRTTCSC